MYTEPEATKPLKGNIFMGLHRKGHRVSIQYCGDCIMGNCCVFSYQYQKVTELSNAISFCVKRVTSRECLADHLKFSYFWEINYVAFKK